ncbi:hypothetical protein L5515_013657 [Caenorhabditis briggsae]|uniref:C-type lectin domain-containing protein n=1 Tax=Caenorhabditis briggsae TaxID=6238 RepID=A0AAE9J6Z1_CAEBR|nr:hypothetical protein L5515_013657 [Caenorhabditis briggsae]
MKNLMLLVLLSTWICVSQSELICSNGFKLMPNGKCWGLVGQQKNYDDANDMCRKTDGSVMVQLKDETDNVQMGSFLSPTRYWNVYLGMRWELQWDDMTLLKNYSRYTPGHADPSQSCVQFSVQGAKWSSVPCSTKLPFVCEQPPFERDCGQNCGIIYNNSCYRVFDQKKTFDSAQSVCELYKSNLVSINYYEEFRLVATKYGKAGAYWIGGKMHSDLTIDWNDGSKGEYDEGISFWDGRCLLFNVLDNGIGSTYVGSDCQNEAVFMCKRPVVLCKSAEKTEL